MKQGGKELLIWILGAMVAIGAVAASKRDVPKSAREKARYYYMLGAREQALEHSDAAYEFYQKAYQADPTYAEAASGYGRLRLGVPSHSDDMLGSLEMMRDYVDLYPNDMYESTYYGYVAGMLDTLKEAERVLNRTVELFPQQTDLLVQLAEVYARAGEFTRAADVLGRYERIQGFYPNVTTRKMSYYMAAGDTLAAKRQADSLIVKYPRDSYCVMLKGAFYDIINKKDSALLCYLAAEKIDPDASAPKIALAEAYLAAGDSVRYDEKIYQVLGVEDLDVAEKTNILSQYLQKLIDDESDTSRGDTLFNVLRKQYPHNEGILDLSARYSAAKGNFKEAEEEIGYAIDLDNDNKSYWTQLMSYQVADDRPEEALKTFGRAAKHIAPDASMRLYYAAVAMNAKRYSLAYDTYRQMIHEIDSTVNPDTLIDLGSLRRNITLDELERMSDIFTMLGDSYHTAEVSDSSYLAYDNALTLNPDNVLAKNNYAYFIVTDGGDLDKALRLAEEVMKTDQKTNPTYIDTYAWILFKKGRLDEAIEYQKKGIDGSVENSTESEDLYEHYGDMLMAANRGHEAADAYQKGLDLHAGAELTEKGKEVHATLVEKLEKARQLAATQPEPEKPEAEKAEEKDKKADDAQGENGENGEIVVVEEISE